MIILPPRNNTLCTNTPSHAAIFRKTDPTPSAVRPSSRPFELDVKPSVWAALCSARRLIGPNGVSVGEHYPLSCCAPELSAALYSVAVSPLRHSARLLEIDVRGYVCFYCPKERPTVKESHVCMCAQVSYRAAYVCMLAKETVSIASGHRWQITDTCTENEMH